MVSMNPIKYFVLFENSIPKAIINNSIANLDIGNVQKICQQNYLTYWQVYGWEDMTTIILGIPFFINKDFKKCLGNIKQILKEDNSNG